MNYFLLNLCIIIIICILLFYRYKNDTKNTNTLIKDQGWNLYLLDLCPHCNTQLQDLSTFTDYVVYNEDGSILLNKITDTDLLPFNEIKSFPLWYNTKSNEKKYGVHDLKSILLKPDN